MMQTVTENAVYKDEEILELSREYIAGTVKVFYLDKPIPVEEIGGVYIQVDSSKCPMVVGEILTISYSIADFRDRYIQADKIKQLEERMDAQEKAIKELLIAMRNRVDIDVFNAHLRVLERTLGINLHDPKTLPAPYPRSH